jgi:hypothetical protein
VYQSVERFHLKISPHHLILSTQLSNEAFKAMTSYFFVWFFNEEFYETPWIGDQHVQGITTMLDVKKGKEQEVGKHPYIKQGSNSLPQQWKTYYKSQTLR